MINNINYEWPMNERSPAFILLICKKGLKYEYGPIKTNLRPTENKVAQGAVLCVKKALE